MKTEIMIRVMKNIIEKIVLFINLSARNY